MTATILQFKPRPKPAMPVDLSVEELADLYALVITVNSFMLTGKTSHPEDNFELFTDERYPGLLLADVFVHPRGVVQGLFYVDRESYKLCWLGSHPLRHFTNTDC